LPRSRDHSNSTLCTTATWPVVNHHHLVERARMDSFTASGMFSSRHEGSTSGQPYARAVRRSSFRVVCVEIESSWRAWLNGSSRSRSQGQRCVLRHGPNYVDGELVWMLQRNACPLIAPPRPAPLPILSSGFITHPQANFDSSPSQLSLGDKDYP
jgi:hypothetical protein